jgi:hypothetical protein
MVGTELEPLPRGFTRTEWGVIQKDRRGSGELIKIIDIPSDKEDLVTLSQYVAGAFAKCGMVLFNIDYSVPIYPHERVIIDNLMENMGKYHDGGVFVSSLIDISENALDKISILSCSVLCMISYCKSFQLLCENSSKLFICINEQGIFSEIGNYFDIRSSAAKNSLSDCPPAPWVLDMLSQSQS